MYPGYFKTNFLLQGSLRTAADPIDAYTEARELEKIHNEQIIGNQPGDPEKAALAFIELAENENAPLHFFMGSDSISMAKSKIDLLNQELASKKSLVNQLTPRW